MDLSFKSLHCIHLHVSLLAKPDANQYAKVVPNFVIFLKRYPYGNMQSIEAMEYRRTAPEWIAQCCAKMIDAFQPNLRRHSSKPQPAGAFRGATAYRSS